MESNNLPAGWSGFELRSTPLQSKKITVESGQSPGTIISVSDLDGKRAASINAKGDCMPTLSQGMPYFDAPEIKPASKRRGFLQKLSRR